MLHCNYDKAGRALGATPMIIMLSIVVITSSIIIVSPISGIITMIICIRISRLAITRITIN